MLLALGHKGDDFSDTPTSPHGAAPHWFLALVAQEAKILDFRITIGLNRMLIEVYLIVIAVYSYFCCMSTVARVGREAAATPQGKLCCQGEWRWR